MRRRPSPSLVVSIVALVFAVAGTSIAAVNYALKAGAVDGKSAVSASAYLKGAAGKLVATKASGPLTGKIPNRFLDLSTVVAGAKGEFAQGIEVVDNASSTPVGIGGFTGLGLITATCGDQNNKAALEDPQLTITFANGSGQTVNFSRSVVAGATATFTINGSNTFHLFAQVGTLSYVMDGVVRQDGANTAAGVCVTYGYALAL